ncbi:DsrE family protein [Streptomyces sp. SAJ15]|uniref:DsrE family protein n=1 Tax=Streptomyces sp. SAJ15 TaxID=2011095 RepID=UPI0021B19DF6|nr:DsrE family protein [Streptomyces sp. SAJ15]
MRDLVPGYLLIESNGPASGPGGARFFTDALALARAGHPVRLVLIQEGIGAAVPETAPELASLLDAGGELWVDRFSVLQRGLTPDDVATRARLVEMDEVAAALLAPDVQVVWH